MISVSLSERNKIQLPVASPPKKVVWPQEPDEFLSLEKKFKSLHELKILYMYHEKIIVKFRVFDET